MINTDNIKEKYNKYQENKTIEARNEIVTASLPMVEQVVSRFQNWKIIEKNDLFQEGVLGVLDALSKCSDVEDFANRLYGYIQGAVLRYSIKQDPVSSNQYSRQKASKINSFIQKYVEENEIEPSNEAIGKALGIKPKNLVVFQGLNNAPAELNENLEQESDEFELLFNEEDLKRMKEIMNTRLSEYEKEILSKKYGLYGEKMTLEKIGKSINPQICKQRVDQIHKNSLLKLRKHLEFNHKALAE